MNRGNPNFNSRRSAMSAEAELDMQAPFGALPSAYAATAEFPAESDSITYPDHNQVSLAPLDAGSCLPVCAPACQPPSPAQPSCMCDWLVLPASLCLGL